MKQKKISVTGIGNAIIDVVASVSEEFLSEMNLNKGSMQLICEEEVASLHTKIEVKKMVSGGSTANTIAGLAYLGDKVAFIGKVKNDRLGVAFEKDLKKLGIIFNTKKAADNCPATACCIVLTTPDSQRTMNTFLGVSCMLSEDDIDEKIISGSKILYTESYLLDQEESRHAIFKALDISKANNTLTSISLSDSNCVNRNLESLKEIIFNKNINICFGNEEEVNQLCMTDKIENAVTKLKNYDLISVITLGERGSIIVSREKELFIGAEETDTVDSTGAGDIYAAGFLHGFIQGRDLYTCARIGSVTAAQIVSQFGARPEKSFFESLAEKGLN